MKHAVDQKSIYFQHEVNETTVFRKNEIHCFDFKSFFLQFFRWLPEVGTRR